jgi:hypothetical protein
MTIEKRDERWTSLVAVRIEGFLRGVFGSREDVPLRMETIRFSCMLSKLKIASDTGTDNQS